MNTWIALLRGINVGGRNRLPMTELVAVLEGIGCEGVKTYIQSGNVVFSRSGFTAPQLAEKIGTAVLNSHGFEPKVCLLTVAELENALAVNPFPGAEDNPKSLHLFFLAETPESPNRESFDAIKADSEDYALVAKVFYLHAPDGIGRSKLAAKAEKLLGVDATGRNWRTATKMLELAR